MSKKTNAGIHAETGFELQKNIALYIILDNYAKFKGKDYFLCIEHHDDFLFCFLDNNEVELIEAYQAKKASKNWVLDETFYNIILGVLNCGEDLLKDNYPKSKKYEHRLSFVTNTPINFIAKRMNPKENETKNATCNITPSNKNVGFMAMPKDIKDKITKELKKMNRSNLKQLEKLFFDFIDLPNTIKEQKNTLIGKCMTEFGDTIPDAKAAVDALMYLFREVEGIFNNGEIAKLMDEKKRVNSKEIEEAFCVLTEKAIAYKKWRKYSEEILCELKIPFMKRGAFKLEYENSIDFFKDNSYVDHNNILCFVENNISSVSECMSISDCISLLCDKFLENEKHRISEFSVKAAIFAAFTKFQGESI